MSAARPRILVITPVRHIDGVAETLEAAGEVTYLTDPTPADVTAAIDGYDAIFTNPNKSNVFISRELMAAGRNLRLICTASTGRNHIDLEAAAERGIAVLSLTEEREVINRISSTAELAFALTLSSIRRLPEAWDAVRRGEWDYEPYIGRQLSALVIGVVGFGRLGRYYSKYARAFGSRVLAHDPFVSFDGADVEPVDLDTLLRQSDVVALHLHATASNRGLVNRAWFDKMKPTVLLVNTARGELIDEADLLAFLTRNADARLAADVIADEVAAKQSSLLLAYAQSAPNVLLSPHIGGMTREGQEIAYGHAARLLERFFHANTTS